MTRLEAQDVYIGVAISRIQKEGVASIDVSPRGTVELLGGFEIEVWKAAKLIEYAFSVVRNQGAKNEN